MTCINSIAILLIKQFSYYLAVKKIIQIGRTHVYHFYHAFFSLNNFIQDWRLSFSFTYYYDNILIRDIIKLLIRYLIKNEISFDYYSLNHSKQRREIIKFKIKIAF